MKNTFSRRLLLAGAVAGSATIACARAENATPTSNAPIQPIPRPTSGHIQVAFLTDDFQNIVDLAGPWETFGSAGDQHQHFELYTVSPVPTVHLEGIEAKAKYSLADAPQPHVVVMGAQHGTDESKAAKVEWIRRVAPAADVVMSVCTGALLLARTGLLDGLDATTHHDSYDLLARTFPRVNLIRNRRFVDNGKFITAGGLTSGIDAALHVVARYYNVQESENVAAYMEHYSDGWRTGAQTVDMRA